MAYSAEIVEDSIYKGSRLTTFIVTFPTLILAQFNTHRNFSRNTSSSRAIPVGAMLKAVKEDPFIPGSFGSNQPGMQAGEPLPPERARQALEMWNAARWNAIAHVVQLNDVGVHKQLANRLLLPWMWSTMIVTSSTYENFFKLRCHHSAQPEIQKIASMMRDLYSLSQPTVLMAGNWHLPLVSLQEFSDHIGDGGHAHDLALISAARCARVSYTKHKTQKDKEDDMLFAKRLAESGHWSPFEHQAKALTGQSRNGNLDRKWVQFRKTFANESGV